MIHFPTRSGIVREPTLVQNKLRTTLGGAKHRDAPRKEHVRVRGRGTAQTTVTTHKTTHERTTTTLNLQTPLSTHNIDSGAEGDLDGPSIVVPYARRFALGGLPPSPDLFVPHETGSLTWKHVEPTGCFYPRKTREYPVLPRITPHSSHFPLSDKGARAQTRGGYRATPEKREINIFKTEKNRALITGPLAVTRARNRTHGGLKRSQDPPRTYSNSPLSLQVRGERTPDARSTINDRSRNICCT